LEKGGSRVGEEGTIPAMQTWEKFKTLKIHTKDSMNAVTGKQKRQTENKKVRFKELQISK